MFLLSARTQGALGRMRENLAHYLETNPGIDPADAAYTLQVGRKTLKYRGFTFGETLMDVVSDLKDGSLSKFQVLSSLEESRPVVFMFSGQGSQYTHMGKGLYKTEPLFRETFDRCFDILKTICPHPLAKILWPSFDHAAVDPMVDSRATGEADERIDQTEIAQPLLFAFEYSLAQLLQAWGVEPAAMIGHSIGEYTAACLSGVFTPEEALKLVTLRGSLMQQLPTGAMLSVNIAEKDILPYLTDQVCLAAVNGHTNCVISGPHQAVAAFAQQMKRKGYETRPLHTSHAFHSHMMEAILEPFTREAAKIKAKILRLPYISNVTGQWIREVETSEPTYWARHLRDTVRFYDGITEILKKEPRAIFIEVGPGRVLSTLVRQYGHPPKKSTQQVLNLTRHPNEQVADDRFLADKLAQLWQYGVSIDWAGYNRGEKRRRISLPTYPFERQSFAPRSFGGKELGSLSGHENRDNEAPALQEIFAGHFQPRPELSVPYAAPAEKTQEILISIWKQFFGIDGIGIRDDFFELGGDSLKGLTMIAEIRKAFNAELTLTHLFTTPTIQGLAETVKNAGEANYYAIESVEEREYYPLSSAQERLYFLQQLRPESVFYNIAVVMEIEGKLDLNQVQIFEHAFETLIGRHESLRTAFFVVDGEPVQVIRRPGDVDFCIQYRELPGGDPGIISDGFIRPFDLARAPLMRLEIVKTGADKYLWLFDIHHIICDASAYAVLIKELVRLYNGEELPPLRVQYRDFSQWQNQLPGSGRIAGQSGYWLKTFSDGVPALNFPTDYPRPKSLEFKGSFLEFHLPEEEALRFLEINGSEGVTLFMSLLAVLNIVLSRYTGKSDIVIGSTSAGRPHHDLREMIGMFVNMLPLRNFPRPHMSFREFLQEVKTSTLQVFENQDVQFEMLVKLLNLEITASRNPLFDICINVENYEHPALEAPGLLFKFYQHRYRNAKFDMLLWARRLEKGIQFMLEYSTELFKLSTAEAFLNHFIEIIRQVIENKDTRLSDIHISQRLLTPESHVPEIDFEL
jgi:phthiocerol/phenolphthiocerol synthesis type-I polyketide synthase E